MLGTSGKRRFRGRTHSAIDGFRDRNLLWQHRGWQMIDLDRRRVMRLGAGLSALSLLAACTGAGLDFGPLAGGGQPAPQDGTLPTAAGRNIGSGPVRVAMLLPLSGDPSLA